jgi:hypothetical protein
MERLKLKRLGCAPIDINDSHHLAEQSDQKSTWG